MHIFVVVVVSVVVTYVSMHTCVICAKIAKSRRSNSINVSEIIINISVSVVRVSENSKILILIAMSKTQ